MKIKDLKRRMGEIVRESGQKNPLIVVVDDGLAKNIGVYEGIDMKNEILISRRQKSPKGKAFEKIEIPTDFIHSVRHVSNEEAAMCIDGADNFLLNAN